MLVGWWCIGISEGLAGKVSSVLGRCWQLGNQDKMEALVYPSFPELRQWLQQVPGFKGHHWVAICFVHPIHSCGNTGLEVCLVAQLVAESAGSDPVGLELVGQILCIPGFWRFVPLWPWLFPCP